MVFPSSEKSMSKIARRHQKNQRGMTLWGKTLNSTANQNKLLVKKYFQVILVP